MAGQGSAPRLTTFAQKLDYLFRTVHPRDGREFSYRDVASGIERAGDAPVSATYLMYLRKGERANPTLQHVQAIARFFKVPVAYFIDDGVASRIVTELDVVAALRDADVRSLALRVSELSPDGLAVVTRMVEEVRAAEGLASAPVEKDVDAAADDTSSGA